MPEDAAVHESGYGPSRHFATAQQLGRFWRIVLKKSYPASGPIF